MGSTVTAPKQGTAAPQAGTVRKGFPEEVTRSWTWRDDHEFLPWQRRGGELDAEGAACAKGPRGEVLAGLGDEPRPLVPECILASAWRRLESDKLKVGADSRQDAVVEVQA